MSNNPDECDHSDGSENGFCIDCGEEVDWMREPLELSSKEQTAIKRAAYYSQWRELNKESESARQTAYYEANRISRLDYAHQYHIDNNVKKTLKFLKSLSKSIVEGVVP